MISDQLAVALIGGVFLVIAAVVTYYLTQRGKTHDREHLKGDERENRSRSLLNTVSDKIFALEGAGSDFRAKVSQSQSEDRDFHSEVESARRRLVDARTDLERYAKQLDERNPRESALRYVEADENLARALHDHRGGYEPTKTEHEDYFEAYKIAVDAVSKAIRELDNNRMS